MTLCIKYNLEFSCIFYISFYTDIYQPSMLYAGKFDSVCVFSTLHCQFVNLRRTRFINCICLFVDLIIHKCRPNLHVCRFNYNMFVELIFYVNLTVPCCFLSIHQQLPMSDCRTQKCQFFLISISGCHESLALTVYLVDKLSS